MSLESDLFEKFRPSADALKDYGFIMQDGSFVYTKILAESSMKAVITVGRDLKVSGAVYDDFDEEYIAFRLERAKGSYAAKVRREYLELLEDIAAKCFHPVPFIFDQTNRIADHIAVTYHDEPEHIFAKFPDYAVFRHESGKWYAIIMEIKEGTALNFSEPKEIIDLKADEETIAQLLDQEGFFPAFHMNRRNWISAVLDDTLSDEVLKELIQKSYEATDSISRDLIRSEWIVPANPKYFDLDHAFARSDLLYWKQSSKVKKGDLVYIYYGAPFSEIRYLCEAVETDLPYDGDNDGPIRFEKLMRLKKLHFFDGNLLNRRKIAEYGVTNIRGPRYMPSALKEEIRRLYQLKENEL